MTKPKTDFSIFSMTRGFTKRRFLQSLSLSALGTAIMPKSFAQETEELWDLIVIGGGNAGLPAAIFAARRGARVLIIEAAAQVGGTLFLSTGQMSAAGTKLQKSKGIEDTPQEHYDDIMRLSKNTADPDIVRLAVDNAADTFDWLMESGFEIVPGHPIKGTHHDPYSKTRYVWGPDGGMSILAVLEKELQPHLDDGSVTLMTLTEVTDLLQDEDGTVRGVITKNETGEIAQYRAKQTLMTCGGYASNPEMFEELEGAVDYTDTSYPYSQGAGLTFGEAAGGYIRGGEHHLPLFGAILGDEDYPTPVLAFARNDPPLRAPWEIYVDVDGKRFMREDAQTHDEHEQILLELQDERCWMVFDQAILDQAPPVILGWEREEIVDAFAQNMPMFYKADTLGALAAAAGVNADNFAQTVAAYNGYQANGDDPFGREHMPAPIAQGPFYAIRLQSWQLTSFAGLAVDSELRVIREDGTPIPNLYAAGEVLGSSVFMGRSYCGGMLVTPALTFGRLLGDRILQFDT